MKIGFDARMIDHPGIGTYSRCLLSELIRQSGNDSLVLFGSGKKLEAFALNENVSVVEWDPPIYSLFEQTAVPYNRHDIDMVHIPHFNIPLGCKKKMVVTIHDLIYLLFPRSVPSPLARYYASFMIKKSVEKAGRIISVSENTKKDLTEIFGGKYKDKISVVYEAADKELERISDNEILSEIRTKYGFQDKIILYIGSVKPHKNVSALIKMYSKLREWGVPHQLVIAGRWDKKENYLKKDILRNNVKYIGEVPSEDLPGLYSLADVLVHLALYEGFGLTVLEAMKCGCPVVSTEVSSLPEVTGEAAFPVSTHNIGQIAETVYNVLANKDLRAKMAAAGIERASQFSWEKTAEETLKVYRSL